MASNMNYYENTFEQLLQIEQGGYGVVLKAKNRASGKLYAIKRLQIGGDLEEVMNEIQIMSKLNNDYVVQYIHSWTEEKVIDRQQVTFVYIQMELCSQNLLTFIELINDSFDESFKTIKFFIRSKLLKEIIECLNHLHSSTPPIFHRDLKPENILVADGKNGRILRLCDFGLSKAYENSQNTRGAGTPGIYMAPEVIELANYDSKTGKSHYDLKSDIYGLGVIATKLFSLKENIKTIRNLDQMRAKYSPVYSNTCLEEKFQKLLEIISNMVSKEPEVRLSCSELLDKTHEWTVDTNTVRSDEKFAEFSIIIQNDNQLKIFQNLV